MTRWWTGGGTPDPVASAPAPEGATPPAGPGEAYSVPAPLRVAPEDNPFGIPILDLRPITQAMLSTTTDPDVAARAVSWGSSAWEGVKAEIPDARVVPHAFRLPVERVFPEGILFTPRAMEQKWVLIHREGRLLGVRSWTGFTELVVPIRRDGDDLVAEEVHLSQESPLVGFGPPGPVAEWLIRSHALGQPLPLPVDADGFAALEREPLRAFAIFGNLVLCAAVSWDPPRPTLGVRADGRVLRAVFDGDPVRLRQLVAHGEPVGAPGTFNRYAPLHIAVGRGDVALVRTLLELGADPNQRAGGGMTPLLVAVTSKAPVEVMDVLAAGGADLGERNDRGFGPVHSVAEIDDPTALSWLLAHGLDIDARTEEGLTPLHIACGLGHGRALQALLAAGADPRADSPMGTGRVIAVREGHAEVAAFLPE